jgi:ABC-type transport system substrate-binding protein
MFAELKDGTPAGGKIIDVQALDDFTVQITFSEADCVAFWDTNDAAIVPAHEFGEVFGEDYALMDEDPRYEPAATFGPFTDIEFEAGARTSLLPD